MKRRNILLLTIFLTTVLVGTITIFFKERIFLAAGDFLVIQDELKRADVIHVMGGDDYRTNYAIQLYKQGYASHLFFTGGLCKDHGWNHGEHGQQLALSQGVPPEAIAIDDSSGTHTYSETLRLKAWLDQSSIPIRSVIVVSDPFNMRRYQWIHRRVLGKEAEIFMAPVPFRETAYQQMWWKDQASRRYVQDEYLKSVYYFFRFQLAWPWLRNWLASLEKG